MTQETTKEFGARLRMAVNAHPNTPASNFGRQTWLRERLAKEENRKVSANAVHKWMNGDARPREDNIRAIAKLLSIDEAWLSMGITPNSKPATAPAGDMQGSPFGAHAGTLLLAGLVQSLGGTVIFAPRDEPVTDLWVDMGKGRQAITVVSPEEHGGSLMAVVTEPVGDNRLIGCFVEPCDNASACLDLYDLTDCPRQKLGGYSIINLERRPGRKLKVEGSRGLVNPAGSITELV